MLTWIMLGLTPIFSVLVVVGWRQWLRAHQGDPLHMRLASGVWAPLLASAGFLGLLANRGEVEGGTGALMVNLGPLFFALVAGRSLMRGQPMIRGPLGWPLIGVMLVLVAAAGRVPHTVGLLVSALAVVLLWFNSMPPEPPEHGRAAPADERPGGLLTAILAAVALALAAGLSPTASQWLIASWLIILAILIFVTLHFRAGESATLHATGWFAITLPAVGLGVLGHDRLVGMFSQPALLGPVAVPEQVHHTAGLLVPGLIILMVSFVVAGAPRWPVTWVKASGLLTIAAGLGGLLAWWSTSGS